MIVNSVAPEAVSRNRSLVISDTDDGEATAKKIDVLWEGLHDLSVNPAFILTTQTYIQLVGDIEASRVDDDLANFCTLVNRRIRNNDKATAVRRDDPTREKQYDPKMLFILPAGETGTSCLNKQVQRCEYRVAVTHQLRLKGAKDAAALSPRATAADADAIIWVAALKDTAGDVDTDANNIRTDRMAAYSL